MSEGRAESEADEPEANEPEAGEAAADQVAAGQEGGQVADSAEEQRAEIARVAQVLDRIEDPQERAAVLQAVITEHRGPLPAPADFSAYEAVLPGAAERILKMAENYAETNVEGSRRTLDAADRKLNAEIAYTNRGQVIDCSCSPPSESRHG